MTTQHYQSPCRVLWQPYAVLVTGLGLWWQGDLGFRGFCFQYKQGMNQGCMQCRSMEKPQREFKQRPQRGARGSYVPDHVRNPQKYTCYVLDEPLTIGGGDDGDFGDVEQVRAVLLYYVIRQPPALGPPAIENLRIVFKIERLWMAHVVQQYVLLGGSRNDYSRLQA